MLDFSCRQLMAAVTAFLVFACQCANASLALEIDEVPDPISNNTPYGNWAQSWAGTFQNFISQSFTLATDATIIEAEMYLLSSSGTRNAVISIRSGGANGTSVAQGQLSVTNVSGWQKVTFGQPVTLSANTEYFLRLDDLDGPTLTPSEFIYVAAHYNQTTQVYSGGQAYIGTNGYATSDVNMRLYAELATQATLTAFASPASINVGQTSNLSTSGGSGTGAVTYTVVSGPCSVSGSTLTGSGAGTCSVTATKAADSTYAAATSAAIDVAVNAVLTLPEVGGAVITIPSGSGSLTLFEKIADPTPPGDVAEGNQIGTYRFTAIDVSSSLTVTIDIGVPIVAGTKAYKVNGSTWTEISAATFGATTVTYTVVDNDPVMDLNPNVGEMEDPVALISPATPSVPATPVPAIPFYGLLVLGGLLGLFGLRNLTT